MRKWVVLIYEIPNKPSSKRLYIWRKLKKLGAVSLQDAVFVLPFADKTLEQMQWLAVEIVEMGGESNIFVSCSTSVIQDEALKECFYEIVRPKYEEILAELEKIDATDLYQNEEDLKKLTKDFLAVKYYDYLRYPLGQQIETKMSELQRVIHDVKYERRD